jgi:septum site-determining protein MinC
MIGPVTIATRPRSSLRFRGRSFLAIVLTPEMPIDGWLAEVDAWLVRAPGFLAGKPLVVDVTGLALGKDDFRALMAELKARSVAILGVEGAEESWLGEGFPPLLTGGRTAGVVEVPDAAAPKSAYPTASAYQAASKPNQREPRQCPPLPGRPRRCWSRPRCARARRSSIPTAT